MGKLWVLFRVWRVPAGRNVDVVELDAAGQLDGRMTAIGTGAPCADLRRVERNSRQNGDPVIPLHPVYQHVPVSERVEGIARE